MDTTVFLAQLWGPAVLLVGIGMFLSRAHYAAVYRNIGSEALAVLIFAMGSIALGVLQVTTHNLWNTTPQIIVSLLGWGLLIKGSLFALVPKFGDRMGDWAADTKLIPIAGAFMLIIGIYLTWIGFLA